MQAVFLGGCEGHCRLEPAAGRALWWACQGTVLPSSVPEVWEDGDVAGRILVEARYNSTCVSGIGADVYDNGAHRNRSLVVCEDRLKSHLDCSGHLAFCIFTSAYCGVAVVINMDLEVCTVAGGDFLSR